MTRALGFLVRNWPLKLAAIVLATLLYAGLVLSQNARVWPGPIPIQVIHQPTSAFIVGALPDVTNVRYFAAVDVSNRLSSSAFAASIDLAGAKVSGSEPVPATVTIVPGRAVSPAARLTGGRERAASPTIAKKGKTNRRFMGNLPGSMTRSSPGLSPGMTLLSIVSTESS